MKTKSLLVVVLAMFITTNLIAQNPPHGHSLDWVPVQTINSPYTVSGGLNTNAFGTAIDIDGDIAVSGDLTHNSVIVYKREGTVWVQKQELIGMPNSDFGEEVIILNEQIIISSPGESMPNVNYGSVYVYNLNRQTGISSFSQKIECTSSNYEFFGESLAGENNNLIIGSRGDSYNSFSECGAAYICTLSSGQWSTPIRINHPNPHNYAAFGTKVGISGNLIAISAPNQDFATFNDAGAVYIFTLTFKSFKVAVNPTNIITSPNPSSIAQFGSSMVMQNNNLLIGQPTTNNVYHYRANDCNLLQTLYESIPGTNFGNGFDFNDQFLIIGSTEYNSMKGKISIYEWQQGQWQKTQNENPECFNLSTTWFGSCIAISDDYFVVGAPRVENLKSNEKSKPPFSTTPSYVTLIEFFHKEPGLTADAGEDQSSCGPKTITLGGNPTASRGNPDYHYYWHDNNGWSSTDANPTVTPTQNTTYYLEVTDCNGNGNTISDDVEFTIGCKLPVNISNGNIISNVIDQDGNMYILGDIDYSPNPLIINGDSYTPIMDNTNCDGPYSNYFLTKINHNGCVEWLHKFASSYATKKSNMNSYTSNLSIDESGNTIMLIQFCWNRKFISSVGINYDDPYFSNLTWFVKFDPSGSVVNSNFVLDAISSPSIMDVLLIDDAFFLLKTQYTYPSGVDFLIDKYSLNGFFQWGSTITGGFETVGACFLEKLNSNELIITFTQGQILDPDPTAVIGKIINKNNGSLVNTVINSSSDQYCISDIKYSSENTLLLSGEYYSSTFPYFQTRLNILNYSPQTNQFIFLNNSFTINSSLSSPDVFFGTINNEIYVPQNFVQYNGTFYYYFYNIAVLNPADLSVNRIINTPEFSNFTINSSTLKTDFYYEDLLGNSTFNQINLSSGEVGCDGQKNGNSESTLNSKKPSNSSDNDSQINVYPNPATDIIYIESKVPFSANYKVFSDQGSSLMAGEFSSSLIQSLNINSLSPGIYVVQIYLPAGIITKKFIKQ